MIDPEAKQVGELREKMEIVISAIKAAEKLKEINEDYRFKKDNIESFISDQKSMLGDLCYKVIVLAGDE